MLLIINLFERGIAMETDYEKKVIIMKGRQLPVETPNCIMISETAE